MDLLPETSPEAGKKCKHCSMTIPKDASICPYCRKRMQWPTVAIILSACALLIFIILAATNPNVNDFRDRIPSKSPSYRNSSGERHLFMMFSTMYIIEHTTRNNYILFSIFDVDGFYLDLPRQKFLGIAGQIIPISRSASNNQNAVNPGGSSEDSQIARLNERLSALEKENADLRLSVSQNEALVQENEQLRLKIQTLVERVNPSVLPKASNESPPQMPPTQ